MAMSHGYSALAGAMLLNAVYNLVELPATSAAWGWYLSPPADAKFSCKGMGGNKTGCPTAGQPGFEECNDASFECEVEPVKDWTCDVAKIKVVCSKNNGTAFQPKSGGACINLGIEAMNMTKDSEIMWDKTPTCTEVSPVSTSSSAVSAASAGVALLASSAVVLA
eukprot:TRINITY_DN110967_c0_g1_i1.p1 TRINITY_DN110967_c0_g1~~TRINITY_DN110967_c0_g1_i1.p1  ORF type:complete len:165 (-),score=45.16 TRINITY_DN110967_c0_g1_i1:360-854(-)